jgi:hypothetical protein
MSPEGTAECVFVLCQFLTCDEDTVGIEVSRPFGTERLFGCSYPTLKGWANYRTSLRENGLAVSLVRRVLLRPGTGALRKIAAS